MSRIIHKIEEKLKHKKDDHDLHLEHKDEDEQPGHREQLKEMMHKIKEKVHPPRDKKRKDHRTGGGIYEEGEGEEGEGENEEEEEEEGEGKNVLIQILESLGELEF